MSGFDFFVDLTITGTVLGLDHTSEREAVHAVFGGGFAEPLDSFGLVEFGWHEREVVFYGAQAHRLSWLTRENGVEPALVERYGDFPDRLDVDDLLKAVAGQGFPLEEQPCHDDDHVEFRSPVSHMGVLAERSSRTVEKLLGRSFRPPWRSFPNQYERFESSVRHLLPLTDVERDAWFDKREPVENRTDWWGCLAAATARGTGGAGGAAESARQRQLLGLAIHRAAVERGVYPPDLAATTEVGLLVGANLAPDDAVRRWLATAAMPAPSDLRAARLLRDQIHEVQRALPSLTDPELAAELRRWGTVKPNLLVD